MALRFAIIRHIKTRLGDDFEDIVYEYQAERVFNDLNQNLIDELPDKRLFMNEADVEGAFERAWEKTVGDFKKVTLTIF